MKYLNINKTYLIFFILLSMAFNPNAFSVTLSVNKTFAKDGYFTLNWSGGDSATMIFETRPLTTSKVINVNASGSYTFSGKAFGDYNYHIYTCGRGGCRSSNDISIYVGPKNVAPVISQGTSYNITTKEDVIKHFSLQAIDNDGDTLKWKIKHPPNIGNAYVSGTGSSKTIRYTPKSNSSYSTSFFVEVSDGFVSDFIRVNVEVNPIKIYQNEGAYYFQRPGSQTDAYIRISETVRGKRAMTVLTLSEWQLLAPEMNFNLSNYKLRIDEDCNKYCYKFVEI